MSALFVLKGDKPLEAVFDKLPGIAQKKAVRKANVRAMRIIRKAVLARTPVGITAASPKLKREIKSRALKQVRGWPIARVLLLPTRDSLGISPDDPYYYPAAVEYGHDNVAGVNFLRGGYDDAEERAFAAWKHVFGNEIVTQARKLKTSGASALDAIAEGRDFD